MKRFLSLVIVLAAIMCCPGIEAIYAAQGVISPTDPAEVMISSNGINWMVRMSYEQLVLTVSKPDGSIFRKTFDSNRNPYLDISTIIGKSSVCDGSYTYELKIIPNAGKQIRGEESREDSFMSGMQAQKPVVKTGYFLVRGGMIVVPSKAPEPRKGGTSQLEYTYNEDLYVKGSLCVGTDCADPETWGYDVLRLKENNLRVHFDDTSATSSFPANDWRILLNDTADAGANYFAIEDATSGDVPFLIEAGAPDNSLYVEDYGRIGLKTSAPAVELHIVDGDSPAVRLEQDTSSGWTGQVWDLVGNESNFFIRDVTNSSKIPFRIQPSSPSSSLCIKSDGKIGIGTWSPGYPMELNTTGQNAAFTAKRTDGATNFMSATASYAQFGAVSNHPVRILVNSTWKLMLNLDGSLSMSNGATCTSGGVWTNASSRSLKENIRNLSTGEAINTLENLNPVKYNYKADKEENHVGFIAEDAPDLVASKDRKGMSPMDVVAVLTKVVQDQQKTILEQQKANREQRQSILELQKSIQEQQKNISELKAKIDTIENK